MEQKNSQTHKFEIKNFKDVYDYCYANGILDINSFVEKCFKQGFDIKKYGLLGKSTDEVIEKEVIVEKTIEVPVEVIKYVDKIVETPVEVIKYVEKEIIKEVPVEKIVTKIEYISDKDTENKLGEKITELEESITKKDVELSEFRQTLDELTRKLDEPKPTTSNDKAKMLENTLQNLRKELSSKNDRIIELEEINKQLESIKVNTGALYLKDSNLTQRM